MHFDTESTDITCPYCGESYELVVDTSAGEQNYIEDCFVCCAPINFTIQIEKIYPDITCDSDVCFFHKPCSEVPVSDKGSI